MPDEIQGNRNQSQLRWKSLPLPNSLAPTTREDIVASKRETCTCKGRWERVTSTGGTIDDWLKIPKVIHLPEKQMLQENANLFHSRVDVLVHYYAILCLVIPNYGMLKRSSDIKFLLYISLVCWAKGQPRGRK